MAAPSNTEIADTAEALRSEIRRIEKHGHAGLGQPLLPSDVALLVVMRDAAGVLDRVAGDQEA